MTEGQLMQAVLAAYGAHPDLRILRINVGKARDPATGQVVQFGQPGWADLLLLCGGVYAWLELKSPTGRQSQPQRDFERTVLSLGGVYRVVRSLDEAAAAVAELRALAAQLRTAPSLSW